MKKIALAFVLATGLSTNAFAYRSGDSVCASYSGGHNWCGVVVSDTGGKNIQVAIQRVKIKSNMFGYPTNLYGDCAGGQHLYDGSTNTTVWVPRSCLD